MIRSFAKVFSDIDNVFLFIGGNGAILEELQQLSLSLNIDKKIIFLGELTRDGVRNLLLKSHVHVSASYFETFGINMIEALSCGVPVIATKSGGPESFINSKNGMLVSRGNIEDLASAMFSCYKNYDRFDFKIIRKECKYKFGNENHTDRLIRIYHSVVGS